MKRLVLALALTLFATGASAQCNGIFTNNTVCGNATGSSNLPRPTSPSAFLGAAGGTNGQIQYNNAGALGGLSQVDVPRGGTGAASFTANLPLIGNGVGAIAQGTRSGTTTQFGTTSGTLTSGNCVKFDASGNLIDSGLLCSSTSSSIVYPSQYGAVCDGTTDDTTALNNMYSGVTAGSTIQFPNSICKITAVVIISKATSSLFPSGGGITTTGTGQALRISASNVTLRCEFNAGINGPRTPSTGNDYVAGNYGILVNGSSVAGLSNIMVDGCYIRNFKDTAIWSQFCTSCYFINNNIQAISYAGVLCVPCNYTLVDGNYISGISSSNGPGAATLPANTKTNAYGITFTTDGAGNYSTYSIASNNFISSIPTWECLDTHDGINVSFIGNVCAGTRIGIAITTGGAVGAPGPTRVTASSNRIECLSPGNAIYPGGPNSSVGGGGVVMTGTAASLVNQATITGNIINNCGSSETNTIAHGSFFLDNVYDFRITGNVIANGRYRGAIFYDLIYGGFTQNTFDSITAGAIGTGPILMDVQSSGTRLLLSGNWGNSGGDVYYVAAQGGGFQVGIARDNSYFGYTNLYNSATSGNRVDLGATAP